MKKTLLICLSIIMLAMVGCKKETNTWGLLKDGSVTVNVGDTAKLTFTSDGNKCPQWVSDDDFVATVNSEGVVTGRHIGKCVVSVNGLQCTVNVTDKYEGNIYAPWEKWSGYTLATEDYTADLINYEMTKRGSVIPEYTMDTVYPIAEIRTDTTYEYPDPTDSSKYNIVITNDTVYDYENPMYFKNRIVFDYAVGLADRYVDKVIYEFGFKVIYGKWGAYLRTATLVFNANHINDAEPFLSNRYSKSDDGSIHYYVVSGKKLCRIYTNNYDNTVYVTYKGDNAYDNN